MNIMKLKLCFFLLPGMLFLNKLMIAQTEQMNIPTHQNESNQSPTSITHNHENSDESYIAVKFKNLEGKRHLLLGFKKEEGTIGSTYILNSNGDVIFKKENFEMAIFPAYNAIDVSHFSTGTYKARIVSEKRKMYEVSVVINDE